MSQNFKEIPKYCTICQKGPFTSAQNANAHFISIQHNEAEIKAKYANLSPDINLGHQFFCKVCNEQCNGPKSFTEHMASPRHQAKHEKSEQYQLSVSSIDTNWRAYDFDGKRGFCHICNVDMTSRENASQHLNGEKHYKKMQQFQSSQEQNTNCNACQMSFPNQESAELHFRNLHQNNKDSLQSLDYSTNPLSSLSMSTGQHKQPQSVDELDKLFQDFQVNLQNETPPQSVVENLQRSQSLGKNPKGNVNTEYTFSISRGFCNVCQLDLTSIMHRDQHLSGAKHKKAKQAWLAKQDSNIKSDTHHVATSVQSSSATSSSLLEELEYIFEGHSGFCNVCKLELRSVEHARDHLNSTIHKEAKEDWVKADISLSLNKTNEEDIIKPHSFTQSFQAKNTPTEEKPKFTTQSQYKHDQTSFSKPTGKPDHYFDGKRGYCNICDLELTSKQHADQHLSGAKHQKNKTASAVQFPKLQNNPASRQNSRDSEYTFDGNRGFCYVCNLELTSRQHANQHLSGAKHKKATNSGSSGRTESPGAMPGVVPREEMKGQGKGKDEYTFNGSRGYCYVCEIELTSKSHAENHLTGKRHIKAKQRWKQGLPDNVAMYCEICKIQCSGPERMQQHLASKKHKDKMGTLSDEGNDNVIPVSSTDNTKWFTCDVCNCKLNSQQQLDFHKKSPKHRAQEEKMIQQGTPVHQQSYDRNDGNNGMYGQTAPNYGFVNNNMRQNVYSPRENNQYGNYNWNTGSQNMGFYQQNTMQVSPNMEMPSYVRPVPTNNNFRATLPSTHVGLPPATVLTQSKHVLTKSAVHQPQISEPLSTLPSCVDVGTSLVSFQSTPSLGSALTLGSLRINEPFKIDEERSMITLARPNVYRTDSLDNDIAVKNGVNSYRNLACDDTNVKDIADDEDLPELFSPKSDVNIATFIEKEETTKSSFKSANDELSIKLKYDNRGHPDGGYSDEDTQDSSNSQPSSREIIIPEKTTNCLPLYGGSHFVVEGTTDLTSSSSGSSRARRSSGTDTARAIKNRNNSKQSQNSLHSLTDTSLESNVFYEEEKDSDKNENASGNESLEVKNIFNGANATSLETSESLSLTKDTKSGRNPNRNSPYAYYCKTCEKPMNSEKAYRDHIRGQRHLDKVAKDPAPVREHPSTIKCVNNYGGIGFNLTHTKPRSYQIELFSQTLENDRVCFLPTGTGKTLISCMTISAMLQQNPTRQVMFLVDKVLLVLQQSQYIKREIGDRIYERFSHDDLSKTEKRRPLIAALCGGSQKTGGIPLWKHDVIVVTAAYYENLLLNEILRWNDNCLVVFDEAHHCIKNHPFNKLLQGYHRKCPESSRPKLLGLTASPAGQATVQSTIMMLHQLMDNLGGARIALVEENTYELKKFQSSARMEVHYTTMTRKEKSFKEELQLYLLNCYTRLCEETDLLQQFDLGLKDKKNLSEKDLLECAREVDGSLLNSLEITINMANPKEDSKSDRKIFSRNLIKHTQYICIALNVLIESGVESAIEEIQELMAVDPATGFDFAETNGLPCARMKDTLQTCMNVEGTNLSMLSYESDSSPQLSKLIEIITRPEYVNWSTKEAMVLVLVKQRETAFKMKNMLRSHDAIQKLQLKVEAVVGHGSTSGTEQGMTVAQQKQVLENMKGKKYDIVVATSVAEEGVDIPECELVITFNPPSTVTALVQMRGRARKNNSKFIVLCNNSKEKVELEDLMLKERNMIEAAETIIKNQKLRKV